MIELVEMDDILEMLNAETGEVWFWEHTGGNCWAIAWQRDEDAPDRIWVTDVAGPLTHWQTVAETNDLGGWLIGVYRSNDHTEAERYFECQTDDLLDTCRQALTYIAENPPEDS